MTSTAQCVSDSKPSSRLSNWDMLRTISMFAVVIVHIGGSLGPIAGYQTSIISRIALLCDPIFFALSGYFAYRKPNQTLSVYYARKLTTIVLPLFVYSAILYLYNSGLYRLSITGYIGFFFDELAPWWFIPTLIPFLLVAPFLYECLSRLSLKSIGFILKAAITLSIWGGLSVSIISLLESTGHPTLFKLLSISSSLLPATLIPNNYFVYFCLGMLLRRFMPQMSRLHSNKLIILGLGCWFVDAVCSYTGLALVDPSYFWLPATVSIFLIFNRIHIKGERWTTLFEWTARRSYSIYLLQYTTISIALDLFYEVLLKGSYPILPAPLRIFIWSISLATAYFLALLTATVIDNLLLKPLQRRLNKLLSAGIATVSR